MVNIGSDKIVGKSLIEDRTINICWTHFRRTILSFLRMRSTDNERIGSCKIEEELLTEIRENKETEYKYERRTVYQKREKRLRLFFLCRAFFKKQIHRRVTYLTTELDPLYTLHCYLELVYFEHTLRTTYR